MKYASFFFVFIFCSYSISKTDFKKSDSRLKIVLDYSESKLKYDENKILKMELVDNLKFYFPNCEIIPTNKKTEVDSILSNNRNTINIKFNWLKIFKDSGSNYGVGGVDYYTFKGRIRVDIKRDSTPKGNYFIFKGKSNAFQIHDCYQRKKSESSITEKILIEKIDFKNYQSYLSKIKMEFGEERIIEITHQNKFNISKEYKTETKIYFSFINKNEIRTEYVDRITNQILRTETLK